MLVWWSTLFALGVLSFLDTYLDFGPFFRQVNSAIFLLVSLGLFFRITRKIRERTKEQYVERIGELERALHAARLSKTPLQPQPQATAHETALV